MSSQCAIAGVRLHEEKKSIDAGRPILKFGRRKNRVAILRRSSYGCALVSPSPPGNSRTPLGAPSYRCTIGTRDEFTTAVLLRRPLPRRGVHPASLRSFIRAPSWGSPATMRSYHPALRTYAITFHASFAQRFAVLRFPIPASPGNTCDENYVRRAPSGDIIDDRTGSGRAQ